MHLNELMFNVETQGKRYIVLTVKTIIENPSNKTYLLLLKPEDRVLYQTDAVLWVCADGYIADVDDEIIFYLQDRQIRYIWKQDIYVNATYPVIDFQRVGIESAIGKIIHLDDDSVEIQMPDFCEYLVWNFRKLFPSNNFKLGASVNLNVKENEMEIVLSADNQQESSSELWVSKVPNLSVEEILRIISKHGSDEQQKDALSYLKIKPLSDLHMSHAHADAENIYAFEVGKKQPVSLLRNIVDDMAEYGLKGATFSISYHKNGQYLISTFRSNPC